MLEAQIAKEGFVALLQVFGMVVVGYVVWKAYKNAQTKMTDGDTNPFERKVEKLHRDLVEMEYPGSGIYLREFCKLTGIMLAILALTCLGIYSYGYEKYVISVLAGIAVPWIFLAVMTLRQRQAFIKRRWWVTPIIDKKVSEKVRIFWER